MKQEKSIKELIMEYFKAHPNQDLNHGPVVDWVEDQYVAQGHTKPRDTWRGIRSLAQSGLLIKTSKGLYRYDPNYIKEVALFDFPASTKEAIFKRDNYRCVVCNRGKADGVEICADHRKPKELGGSNSIDNGQTLCTQHNLMKKMYSQTEFAKRQFIKLYETAKAEGDEGTVSFCEDIFDVYDKHNVDAHIERPDKKSRLF